MPLSWKNAQTEYRDNSLLSVVHGIQLQTSVVPLQNNSRLGIDRMMQWQCMMWLAFQLVLLTFAAEYHEPLKGGYCHDTLSVHSSTTKAYCQQKCDQSWDTCKGYSFRSDIGTCYLCSTTIPWNSGGSYEAYFKKEYTCAVTIYNSNDATGHWQATYVGDEQLAKRSSWVHSDYNWNTGFSGYGAADNQVSSNTMVG
jgi:hypothetical protein